jgi:hypothetical protein
MRYRARPPLNRQNHSNSCWAAAIDSFSRINSSIPTMRESDLAPRWGDAANAYGLTLPKLRSMVATDLAPHGCRLEETPSLSLPYDIEDKRATSHVVFIWAVGGTNWHAGVVYGIDDSTMSYMETRTGEYRSRAWSFFANPTGYFQIWRP